MNEQVVQLIARAAGVRIGMDEYLVPECHHELVLAPELRRNVSCAEAMLWVDAIHPVERTAILRVCSNRQRQEKRGEVVRTVLQQQANGSSRFRHRVEGVNRFYLILPSAVQRPEREAELQANRVEFEKKLGGVQLLLDQRAPFYEREIRDKVSAILEYARSEYFAKARATAPEIVREFWQGEVARRKAFFALFDDVSELSAPGLRV